MSLRATFLLLLFANLAFLGWAALIDVAPEPPPSDSISNLPQLKLLSEVRGKAASLSPAAAAGSSTSAANGSTERAIAAGSPSARAATTGATSGGAASGGAASGGVAPAGAKSTSSAAVSGNAAGASRRCITIGPFADPQRAQEAAAVLQGRGFTPRGRTASTGATQGYWVFIGGLKSPADETSVLHRLERNGISDAKAMPTSDGGRRVSVGLFNARDGAERRARAVRNLGLDAHVEPRPTEGAHWVDVDLESSTQSLPAEDLLALEEPGARLEIKECPAPEQMQARARP